MRLSFFFTLLISFYLTSGQTPREPDIRMFYNDDPILLKEGIELPESEEPEGFPNFGYTIDSLVLKKMDQRFSRMRMTLVREGKGIVSKTYDELADRKNIDSDEILKVAIPTDHIVVEWKLRGIGLNYSPKVISIQVK